MAEMIEYKCPACGGAVEFNSTAQKMKCPYCDTEFTLEQFEAASEERMTEDDLQWNTEETKEWSEEETQDMGIYVCQSCGGEIVADMTTGASKCPYCDNPVVFSRQFEGDLKPDIIIPFKLDKKAAKEALKKHLSNKILLPKIFKDENHLDEIKGVYVPFWLFEADASADATYKATKVRRWSDSSYRYTETRYYDVYRSGHITVKDIPVDGSKKMPDELMESIEPFDISEATEFKKAYLAGYLADRYDVGMNESVERANIRIKASIENELNSSVTGYVTKMQKDIGVQIENGTVKYALYPVWMLTTSWQGKKYIFAMNGQTGKFVGDLPTDNRTFWKMFGIRAAAFSVIFYILQNLIYTFIL